MAVYACMGCTERHVGCHSTCEKYRQQSTEQREISQKIRSEKAKDEQYRGYVSETAKRNNKRRLHGRLK